MNKTLKAIAGITLLSLAAGSQAMEAGYSVSGSIYERIEKSDNAIAEKGKTFSEVYVELIDAREKVVATARTDKKGRYVFKGVKPGEYQIQIPAVTKAPEDINQLLLSHYISPIGSVVDIEVVRNSLSDIDLGYIPIDIRVITTRLRTLGSYDF